MGARDGWPETRALGQRVLVEAVNDMLPVRVEKGEVLGGKYRIEGVIGEGAMGVVVSAWHIDLQQKVAIKFLHPLLTEREDAVERFLHEARAVVRIESDHVARVLDVGRLDGATPYLVMEFLEGEDLAATLRRRKPFGIQESVDYLQQACEALAEAHAVGVVHRDLKPANLFLVERGADAPRIKVLDFGISKTLTSKTEAVLTSTSVVMGSPIYMSPEQLRSTRDVDGKTDIWALGVVLYEMLTGREPFVAQTLPQLCAMILEGTPLGPRSLRSDIPVELEQVVLRCLQKSPLARYESVAELSQALVPFGSEEASASAERAARSLRRTGGIASKSPPSISASAAPPRALITARKALVATGLLLLGAALVLVLVVVQLLRVRRAENAVNGTTAAQTSSAVIGSLPVVSRAGSAPAPSAAPAAFEPVASGASDNEGSPPKGQRAGDDPNHAASALHVANSARAPKAANASALVSPSLSTPRRTADHPTSIPRSGFDPPADHFGGRE